MIREPKIQAAVSEILQRAEKQPDPSKVTQTFVDVGILSQFANRNNQILYGRRGTGKTHVLLALESQLNKAANRELAVFLDCRTLGSTAQFSDPSVPFASRCLALYRDIIAPIHAAVGDYFIQSPIAHGQAEVLDLLDLADEALMQPWKALEEHARNVTSKDTVSQSAELHLQPSAANLGLSMGASGSESKSLETQSSFKVLNKDKVIFPDLHSSLAKALKKGDLRCWLLLDEWSSIPLDLQPMLAEFLKRSIIPSSHLILKIASLDYRSALYDPETEVGLELGADIALALDLDDYFVYDRNPEHVITAYSEILFRHLKLGLSDTSIELFGIESSQDLVNSFFTQQETFDELARAAEGVVRDLLNIFNRAFFISSRIGKDKITRHSVLAAASKWFETEKSSGLSPAMYEVLTNIIEFVIGKRQSRSFLIPVELTHDHMLKKLVAARVLHLIDRGYVDKESPGKRYNIYTVDYGTYVDLLGTIHEPKGQIVRSDRRQLAISEEWVHDEQVFVPLDDKRRIRHIILSKDILRPRTPQ